MNSATSGGTVKSKTRDSADECRDGKGQKLGIYVASTGQ